MLPAADDNSSVCVLACMFDSGTDVCLYVCMWTGSGQWEVVTSSVLPDAVRASLELRVQGEEDKQQQQEEGYYFDSFKKAVYVMEEVGATSSAQVALTVVAGLVSQALHSVIKHHSSGRNLLQPTACV